MVLSSSRLGYDRYHLTLLIQALLRTSGADVTMGSQKAPTQTGASPRSAEEDYDPLFDDPELDASADLDQGAGGRGVPSALAWRSAVPSLDSETYERYSHNILMTAAIDGQITIWDRRVAGSTPGSGVGRLDIPEKTPPWCVSACWSADGSQLYAGRRNGTVEVWDMRQTRNTHEGTPRLLRTLRNPLSSGAVSCVVAFPDGKHLACASQDNIRLWNVSADAQAEATSRSRVAPFKIIAGHHGGTISQIFFSSTPLLTMAAVAYHHRPAPVPTPPPHTHMHSSEMDMDPRPPSPTSSTSTVTSSRTPDFFRQLHDRQLNCMNTTYMLPADEQEMKRMDIEHRMMKFIMGGKNYVGPVADALTKVPDVQRRVLDCGTGNGLWAIEMADEFDWVEVTGVDLAPIQPRKVPPNCFFELFDLDGQRLPYPDSWFDVVHARSVYTGVRHYSILLRELARVLRPGGVAIFAEVDSTPVGEKKHRIPLEPRGGAPGWAQYWDQVRRALGQLGIDVSIPSQLRSRVRDTREFEHIVAQEAMVPIGFWPKDPVVLSIGQLAWMNYDNLLLALRPLLLDHGITPDKAAKLIEDAQENLYRPKVCIKLRTPTPAIGVGEDLGANVMTPLCRFSPIAAGTLYMHARLGNNRLVPD
ncbi:Transcription factor SPT8 [Rhizoctonia solani AG-1 IB]|uniref:Transcription factor SPT8 n=2 Tax=Rhizoctonia solani TaxID=456999 RepID=M5BKS6_THACB|nr:Transcription factor SPT8 [Rhizoctonia solani AG-1 IB]